MIYNIKWNNKGNLLIELLVVIGILGLFASISAPYIQEALLNLKLTNIAKSIVVDLRFAQQSTVTEQTSYSAKFFYTEKKYQIIKADNAEIIKETLLPAEISYSSISGFTDNTINFNYYGAALEAGNIIIRDNSGKTARIEIKPSGYITYTF